MNEFGPVKWVIIGHADRRTIMGEKEDVIVEKIKAA